MIIILIILFAVATFIAGNLCPTRQQRWFWSGIALIGLVASVAALTLNFTDNFGMREVTKTTTQPIYTAGDPRQPGKALLTKTVGKKGHHEILIYRDKETDKQPEPHFVPSQTDATRNVKVHTKVVRTDEHEATLVTRTSTLTWRNDFYKALFKVSGKEGDLVQEIHTAHIPKDGWMVAESPSK